MDFEKGYFNPKTGENHGIFGYKYLKFHRMRDCKWAAGDKMIQYVGMRKIYERSRKLETLRTIMKRKSKQAHARDVKKSLKDDIGYLHTATVGDHQLVKNIFQNHRDVQRAYHPLLIEKIVEKIDQRTFAKRKNLDQLVNKLEALSSAYENEVIKVAELQDRTKFTDPQELYEEIEAKRYELELRHCATRVRTTDAVNRAYYKILNTMLKDSMYYDPVLNALQEDLEEQKRFILKAIGKGRPSMKNVKSLRLEFQMLEKQTNNEMAARFKTLMEHRNIVASNTVKIKTFVRRDSDFDVNPSRYDRDTTSMADLKTQMDEIEKILKQLKNATSTGKPKEIYPRVKQQETDCIKMESNLVRRQHETIIEQLETDSAELDREKLANDFTPEEIRFTVA
ncbi:uncharacterized protein LOC129746900 [Uranotaenia lowii]|uniref:uncharacterized protein LOC129746900 n=1 Tax=Uranotaenia lowii TaxID=190385 RepID=UPI00247AF2B0|nr:uncharacterized protein LOC129746900 [Uranotaenia lowii]